jgi:hypothetical protein
MTAWSPSEASRTTSPFSPLFQRRTEDMREVVKILDDKCSELGHSSPRVSFQTPQDQQSILVPDAFLIELCRGPTCCQTIFHMLTTAQRYLVTTCQN